MAEAKKLPLKVVPAMETDFYHPDAGGGPKKVFGEVTKEFRQNLSTQVIEIRDHFADSFRQFPSLPAVARVKVREDAIAKSHRPAALFTERTCPIIGAEGLGDLLLRVTRPGLEQLARRIETNTAKSTIANLSTLRSLEAFSPKIERPQEKFAKVKLFLHHAASYDLAVDQTFTQLVKRFGIREPREVRYGRGLKIYRIDVQNPELFAALGRFVGTQSVGPFPLYAPVRSNAVTIRNLVPDDFPKPNDSVDYPVVGVIDSGTSEGDAYLAPWRIGRDVHVVKSEQDTTHGSFVSGLIVHARVLNHGDKKFPLCSAKFLDVVALGKNGTSEDKLISALEQAVEAHPEIKVWNLSLGTEQCVADRSFSDFGVALDRLQDEHGVTFIVAAGNYRQPPFRGWPPDDLGDDDRVCAPADSLRAIVVGSVAHRDHSSSRVKSGQPSPFSRRGPGPLYLPKPELSHLGGNCNAAGTSSQIGVLSLDGKGNVAEDIGTSFAAPLVSSLFANVGHRIHGGGSRLLSRALLVHSAALKSGKIDPTLLRYQGFGIPADVDVVLGCDPWQCTLIFELDIRPAVAYEKASFPMPSCLYLDEDTVKANILMTLVHEPDLDASFGSEYCRSNVEVSLGTYDSDKDGNRRQKKQVPEDPRLAGSAYEQDLVEHGFKWSPVKVYRREMIRGVRGEMWRLDLYVTHRAGHSSIDAERAVLLITVSDPEKKAPVYDQMVVQMNKLGWAATDLQIRPRIRA